MRSVCSRNILVVVLALLVLSATGSPVNAQTKNSLRFAFSDGFAPYSYSSGGHCAGMAFDLLSTLFEQIPTFDLECKSVPWKRAQHYVMNDVFDGFVTYPSKVRKSYANFSNAPLYVLDFGYIAFSKDNPRAAALAEIRSYGDLEGFKFGSLLGVGWEEENVPQSIERVIAPNNKILFNLIFRRGDGDFFIMGPEQAVHYASQFGLRDKLVYVKAPFLKNSVIEFHIGIRKSHDNRDYIVSQIDKTIADTAFQQRYREVIGKYRN